MGRLLPALAAALALASGAAAGTLPYDRVVARPGRAVSALEALAAQGAAIGLVVPDAGPQDQ